MVRSLLQAFGPNTLSSFVIYESRLQFDQDRRSFHSLWPIAPPLHDVFFHLTLLAV